MRSANFTLLIQTQFLPSMHDNKEKTGARCRGRSFPLFHSTTEMKVSRPCCGGQVGPDGVPLALQEPLLVGSWRNLFDFSKLVISSDQELDLHGFAMIYIAFSANWLSPECFQCPNPLAIMSLVWVSTCLWEPLDFQCR